MQVRKENKVTLVQKNQLSICRSIGTALESTNVVYAKKTLALALARVRPFFIARTCRGARWVDATLPHLHVPKQSVVELSDNKKHSRLLSMGTRD